MARSSRARRLSTLVLLLALVVVAAPASIAVGTRSIRLGDVWRPAGLARADRHGRARRPPRRRTVGRAAAAGWISMALADVLDLEARVLPDPVAGTPMVVPVRRLR